MSAVNVENVNVENVNVENVNVENVEEEEEGEWETCVEDNAYEINTAYPYPIRKKSNGKIISENIMKIGYPRVKLNQKDKYKHIIVAKQWLENDDPAHKTDVDHIDTNRTNYHLNNLRWVSKTENNRNRSGNKGITYTYLNELPEGTETLESYGKHDLDGYYINHELEKVYVFNGVRYRELVPVRNKGNIAYYACDVEGKKCKLYHKVLF